MDLVESGKMSEESFNSFLDTLNDTLELVKAGKLDENGLITTMYSLDQLLEQLKTGKITLEEFNNYLNEIKKLIKALGAGEIDIDTYNKLVRELLNKMGINKDISITEIKETLNVSNSNTDIIKSIESLGTDVSDKSSSSIISPTGHVLVSELSNSTSNNNEMFEGKSIIDGSVNGLKDKVDNILSASGDKSIDFSIIGGVGGATGAGLIGKEIYNHTREKYIKFTPEDWDNLSVEKKNIIERVMIKVGFDDFMLNDFKKANYKVLKDKFDTLKDYLYKSVKQNIMIRNELLRLYRFDVFFDDQIIDYLFFIMMIIDGKSLFDEYNFIRTVEKFNLDENDILYDGLSLIECIDS